MRMRAWPVSCVLLAFACAGPAEKANAPRMRVACVDGECSPGETQAARVEIVGNLMPWGPGTCGGYIAFRTGGDGTEGDNVKWTLGDTRIQRFMGSGAGTTTITTALPVSICGAPTNNGWGYGYTTLRAEWGGSTADSLFEWGQTPSGLTPASVQLQPGNVAIAKGTSRQYEALGIDQFFHSRTKTKTAAWASDNPGIASVVTGNVGQAGLVWGLARGVANITANVNGTASAAAAVTVKAVTSVIVTPASGNVVAGGTLALTASPRDQFGNAISWPVAWTSASPGIATVSPSSGLVTGVAAGQATIRATADGVTGTSTVTVLAPLALTNLSTNPSPPIQYLPATYTIDGSGFDPATVEVVIRNDLCDPWWGDCDSYIRNDMFRIKTSTQLVADNIAYSISGPYHLYVRNTGTGLRSGSVAFTIQPMYNY